MAELRKLNPDRTDDIGDAIHKSGRSETDLGYSPMRAKYQDQAVLVGKSDGQVLAVLRMRPW